jgi:hypothetical protein
MDFHRNWSPLGFDRAVELFEKGALLASAVIALHNRRADSKPSNDLTL